MKKYSKEEMIMFIWLCVCITLVSSYIVQGLFATIKVLKLSGGTTLTIDPVGIGEIILICSAYYMTKMIINRKDN